MQADYDSKGKVTKSAEQKRKEFDRMLAPPTTITAGAPSWWTDDDDAAASAFMAARQLGVKVPETAMEG